MERESECIAHYQDCTVYEFVCDIFNERDVKFLETNETVQAMVEHVNMWLVNATSIVILGPYIGTSNVTQYKEAFNDFDPDNLDLYGDYVYSNIKKIFSDHVLFLKPWLNNVLNKIMVDIQPTVVGKVLLYLLLNNKLRLHQKLTESYRYGQLNPFLAYEHTVCKIRVLNELGDKTYRRRLAAAADDGTDTADHLVHASSGRPQQQQRSHQPNGTTTDQGRRDRELRAVHE